MLFRFAKGDTVLADRSLVSRDLFHQRRDALGGHGLRAGLGVLHDEPTEALVIARRVGILERLEFERDANRFVLQILLALNRIAETAEPLRAEIAQAPVMERNAALSANTPQARS